MPNITTTSPLLLHFQICPSGLLAIPKRGLEISILGTCSLLFVFERNLRYEYPPSLFPQLRNPSRARANSANEHPAAFKMPERKKGRKRARQNSNERVSSPPPGAAPPCALFSRAARFLISPLSYVSSTETLRNSPGLHRHHVVGRDNEDILRPLTRRVSHLPGPCTSSCTAVARPRVRAQEYHNAVALRICLVRGDESRWARNAVGSRDFRR